MIRRSPMTCYSVCVLMILCLLSRTGISAEESVEGQPLAANAARLIEALEFLGQPLPSRTIDRLQAAIADQNSVAIQQHLDSKVLAVVRINPESRVKLERGKAPAQINQNGYTAVLIKVINEGTVTSPLRITSPQAGAAWSGSSQFSLTRQDQVQLKEEERTGNPSNRFLHLDLYDSPPMSPRLSGLEVEYAILLVYSSEAGKREARLVADVGQGTEDLGFRAELPVLFNIHPAIRHELVIRDADGRPTTARLEITDQQGHVYPPQPRRGAPDFFFQRQIYRHDGEAIHLPPGRFTVRFSRGPEYRILSRQLTVARADNHDIKKSPHRLVLNLQRWVNPAAFGFFSGDHHIHAAGCAHYTVPTEGVDPSDMFRQIRGEGLNVGCVLTWGPCFDHQRQFFSGVADALSDSKTIMKYDLEISGFGSQALGHVCLLNLKDQVYPGSDGTSTQGWPTWTTPVMKWARAQNAVTGYAHSASGLWIDPDAAAARLISQGDGDRDERLSKTEALDLLLPESFQRMDSSRDGFLETVEIRNALARAADQLLNLAIPEMNGVGAMEIAVTTALGVCDFISAMDTRRIQEWNTWYHLLNCGFPLKVSGETDFPCMSSTRVGQGRVYVRLGDVEQIDFTAWCRGLAAGTGYVSDGYAHALDFRIGDRRPGPEPVRLGKPGPLQVEATVIFADELPAEVAHGTADAPPHLKGDTVTRHGVKRGRTFRGGNRRVELIVNGRSVASREVSADAKPHEIRFEDVMIADSSWIALRQFPQLHTNPITVIVDNRPIRASEDSARWCLETIRLLWKNRERAITAAERPDARKTFDAAMDIYRRIGREASQRSR